MIGGKNMAKHYAIWDKQSPVLTPSGEIFTAAEWKAKFPVAALDNITVVCAAGEINGALFGTLGQMVQVYESEGADFSSCKTDEDKLAVIEAFDEARENASSNTVSNEELTATSLASIASSLEYQNMMTLDDVTVE